MKPLAITRHAATVIAERGLDMVWVDAAIRHPDWTEPDRTTLGALRCFRAIPERDGRTMRVVIVETTAEIRILTTFLDRDAVRPQ